MCGRKDKAQGSAIKERKHATSESRSIPESLSGIHVSPNLLCLDRAAARHTTDIEDCEHQQVIEDRARRMPGGVASINQKRSQVTRDTYAGLRPNPRASNQLRRLRKSRPTPRWSCCRFPRRLPWFRSKLDVTPHHRLRPRSSVWPSLFNNRGRMHVTLNSFTR